MNLKERNAAASDANRSQDEDSHRSFDSKQPNTYELRELKAGPALETDTSIDQQAERRLTSQLPQFPVVNTMPTTPGSQWFRSSPGLGSGSYGALPVHDTGSSLGSSDIDEAEDDDVVTQSDDVRRRRGLLRGSDPTGATDPRKLLRAKSSVASSSAALDRRKALRRQRQFYSEDGRAAPAPRKARGALKQHDDTQGLLDGTRDGKQHAKDQPNGFAGDDEDVSLDDSSADQSSDDEDASVKGDSNSPPDDSPYAQVRASVAPTDDTSLSINTPRMWTLSMLFAILGSSTNLFFSLRYPSVSITPVIALLLAHPIGLLWDQLLRSSRDEDETFVNGSLQSRGSRPSSPLDPGASDDQSYWHKLRLWLAQGQWNAKEHACVYISSNVSFGFAFATDVSFLMYSA